MKSSPPALLFFYIKHSSALTHHSVKKWPVPPFLSDSHNHKDYAAVFISLSVYVIINSLILPCGRVWNCIVILLLLNIILPAGIERLPRSAWSTWQEGAAGKSTIDG